MDIERLQKFWRGPWSGQGPCACMGPQGEEPLCPCLMRKAEAFVEHEKIFTATDLNLVEVVEQAKIINDTDSAEYTHRRQAGEVE